MFGEWDGFEAVGECSRGEEEVGAVKKIFLIKLTFANGEKLVKVEARSDEEALRVARNYYLASSKQEIIEMINQ